MKPQPYLVMFLYLSTGLPVGLLMSCSTRGRRVHIPEPRGRKSLKPQSPFFKENILFHLHVTEWSKKNFAHNLFFVFLQTTHSPEYNAPLYRHMSSHIQIYSVQID